MRPVRDGFVDQTLSKHRGLLKHLYRTFEALRGEDRTLRRQPFGDDIDIEREALVLLCESLEILGDRYAIFGFSGMTRKRCELFRIKRFDESYNPQVRARISGILPQDYTRMGVAIRHLSRLLNEVEARWRCA